MNFREVRDSEVTRYVIVSVLIVSAASYLSPAIAATVKLFLYVGLGLVAALLLGWWFMGFESPDAGEIDQDLLEQQEAEASATPHSQTPASAVDR